MNKFKSDVGLWVQYIEVAKREGARALVGRITARCDLYGYENNKLNLRILQGAAAASEPTWTVYLGGVT